MNDKKILFSGIQPTGSVHIGNYLGAIKNWVELQNSNQYNCIFSVVDLHAITIDYDPKQYQERILDLAATLLACGIDPKKVIFFKQSDIKEHAELCWLFNTIIPVSELYRMTQFKDKVLAKIKKMDKEMAQKLAEEVIPKVKDLYKKYKAEGLLELDFAYRIKDEIIYPTMEKSYFLGTHSADMIYNRFGNAGLLDYPVLMAADILLYGAQIIPVGEDQFQHLELTNTIVKKFNNKFGEHFKKVDGYSQKGARIMSLSDPQKKMSKSIPSSCLFLDDSSDEIRKKIGRAVTDSDPGSEMSKGVKNLFDLLDVFGAKEELLRFEKEYKNKTIKYSELKSVLAEVIIKTLEPIQKRKKEILKNPEKLKKMLEDGSKKAKKIAENNIKEIKKRMGLL